MKKLLIVLCFLLLVLNVSGVRPVSPDPGTLFYMAPDAVEIIEGEVPLALNRSWALANLLLTIATSFIAMGMVLTMREDEEEGDILPIPGEREEKTQWSKLLGIVPAVLSLAVFVMTEDLTTHMVLTDRYSVYMAVITAVAVLFAVLTRHKKHGFPFPSE